MYPKVGIGILVLEQTKILLSKRKTMAGKGQWAPPGGHLEYGEGVKEAAQRELREETGLIAEELILGPWTEEYPDPHYISIYTFVTKFSGTLQNCEPEKHEDWQWFDYQDLPGPLFGSMSQVIVENSLTPFLHKHLLSNQV